MIEQTRDDDEKLLQAMRLRDRGKPYAHIVARLGRTRDSWKGMFARVRADLEASERPDAR